LGSGWSWVIVIVSIALLLVYLVEHRGVLWLLLHGPTSG
jgi:hypothetical protein